MRTNFYSVPMKAGAVVEARAYSNVVEFRQDQVRVAHTNASMNAPRSSSLSSTISSAATQAKCVARFEAAGAMHAKPARASHNPNP